jgi:hypothetical protein
MLKVKTVITTGGTMRSMNSIKALVRADNGLLFPAKKRKGKALQKKITAPQAAAMINASEADSFMMFFL